MTVGHALQQRCSAVRRGVVALPRAALFAERVDMMGVALHDEQAPSHTTG